MAAICFHQIEFCSLVKLKEGLANVTEVEFKINQISISDSVPLEPLIKETTNGFIPAWMNLISEGVTTVIQQDTLLM